jgi:hypothetical protein
VRVYPNPRSLNYPLTYWPPVLLGGWLPFRRPGAQTFDRTIAMKMKATIEVEFEAGQGQTQGGLETALLRGMVSLKSAIEHGISGSPMGIKHGPGTARVEVVEKNITT